MTAVADLISRADRDRLLKRLAEWRDLDGAMRKPGGMPAVPEPPALHQMAAAATPKTSAGSRPRQHRRSDQMTEPSDQPGADIRAGDKVTHRETGGTGHVEGVLPVYGGFGAAPWLSEEQTVLLVVAVVSWQGQKKLVLERATDLIKIAEGNDQLS